MAIAGCALLRSRSAAFLTRDVCVARNGHQIFSSATRLCVPALSHGVATFRALSSASGGGEAGTGKVAFVGLGNMGSNMARNLQKKGCDLVLYDVNPENPFVKELASEGATVARSVEEMCSYPLSAVLSMVIAPKDVYDLYCGPSGVLRHLTTKPILMDCSTIDPKTAGAVAKEAAAAGHRMADAPVGGGVPAASAGTLTFMVGASDEDFQSALPFLEKMGKNIYHCGGPSSGQAAKICNNLILGASMLGVAEGFRLGEALGVDPKKLFGIVNNSSGRCWSSDTWCPVPGLMEATPASRDYHPPSYVVDLLEKDLKIAIETGEAASCDMPISTFSHKVYKQVQEAGHGRLDIGCVFKHMPKGDKN
eukprot:TRINITY_DN14576_c0_g1_i1.p1 TRINITY_DN14576_c0_g1~~TRINITY_DN14576_c0_g1_i1.p1  ORF type:complete len:393 (-),score=72.54 TRINITY_DN14576_c0_g1_i1:108-1202(-)